MASSKRHAVAKLDITNLHDDDYRSVGARRLIQAEDTNRSGIALFKYHALANASAATSTAISPHQMKAATEHCFASFSDEQKQYWANQTVKLSRGDGRQLEPVAFHEFTSKYPDAVKFDLPEEAENLLIDLQFDDTPESSPSKSVQSDSPGSSTSESSVEMAAIATRSQMSGSPTGRSKGLHAELGFEAPPQPYIPRKYRQGDGIWRSSAIDTSETTKYPILKLICKRQTLAKLSHQEIISTILHFLDHRIARDEESNLVGRYLGMQLNYDAGATNVRGIQARLTASTTRKVFVGESSEPVEHVLADMEALMRPFIVWNSGLWTMSEFESIEVPGKHDGKTYTDDYDSCLGWFEREFSHLLPVGQGNKNAAVNAILGFLREKARLHSKSRDLLKYTAADIALPHHSARRADPDLYSRVKKFSLKDRKSGFATQLLSCFDRQGLSGEEYLDFIEQKVYKFHREFPDFNLMQPSA